MVLDIKCTVERLECRKSALLSTWMERTESRRRQGCEGTLTEEVMPFILPSHMSKKVVLI